MICCNEIPSVVDYGSSASYCCLPTPEQVANGVVPLDSLPAAWWNAMWAETNRAVNCARGAVGSLITELNTVLTQAGVCACATCTDQLYQSINIIRQRIGDASVAGAVKSSSTCGQVSISNTGIMTANGLGNTSTLNTTSKEATGAINELKSTYDTCWTNNTTALGGKAPNAHASTATTYGVGNADCYGHLKISDTYTSVLSACSGVAASQKALACVYAVASAKAAVGDTAGCALGTAAAGTCATAARSDHVHPKPTQVDCSCKSYLTSFTACADRPVMVTCPSCCSYQIVGYSTACSFTFNPSTGEVKAKTFTGAFSGTVTNATCFGGCTYAQAKADILTGCAADSNKFGGCTYACAKKDILTGCAADSNKFGGCTYACAKADIRNYTPATATNATCFGGCTYAQAKADIRNYTPATATNATCFGGCTYAQAKADILTGCAADSTKLGGTAAACYLLKTGCAADSAKLGGTAAACYALKAGCVACAGANGSGTAFGTAAVCAANCFAPKAHAAAATTYGAGNASNYGHVKLSDTYTSSSNGTAACSVGASQCAVYSAYTAARCLGNATAFYVFKCAATAEAAAASCQLDLGRARSYRWCSCTTSTCSKDHNTYLSVGVVQPQNEYAGCAYLQVCKTRCCYTGSAACSNADCVCFYFCSTGEFLACSVNTGCGVVGRHCAFGKALRTDRNATSGYAAVTFSRNGSVLGYLAMCADARFVRFNTTSTTSYTILDTSAAVTVAQGGTGATSAADARTNLGLGTAATYACGCFAPKAHASTATTYGVGTTANYGHLKICDSYTASGGNASSAVAASSCAAYLAYECGRQLSNVGPLKKETTASTADYPAAGCCVQLSCVAGVGSSSSNKICAYFGSCVPAFGSGSQEEDMAYAYLCVCECTNNTSSDTAIYKFKPSGLCTDARICSPYISTSCLSANSAGIRCIASNWIPITTGYTFCCAGGSDSGKNWFVRNIAIDPAHCRGCAEIWNCTALAYGKAKEFCLTLPSSVTYGSITYSLSCPINPQFSAFYKHTGEAFAGNEVSACSNGRLMCAYVYNRNASTDICCGHYILRWDMS